MRIFKKKNIDVSLKKLDSFIPKNILNAIDEISHYNALQGSIGGGQKRKQNGKICGGGVMSYYKCDKSALNPKSPLNPWAFIRVKNEAKTLKASLYSMLPAIQRGVIAYNDCTDGSEKIILEFCEKYPSFLPLKYPHKITLENPASTQNMLHTYYNFALQAIPKNEWFIKIDCDHIYDAKMLYKTFYLIESSNDFIVYPRINFIIKNNHIFIQNNDKYGYLTGEDQLLICNNGISFIPFKSSKSAQWLDINDTKENLVREMIDFRRNLRAIFAPLMQWHFPAIKERRVDFIKHLDLLTLQDFIELNRDLIGKKIPHFYVDKDVILGLFHSFDLKED